MPGGAGPLVVGGLNVVGDAVGAEEIQDDAALDRATDEVGRGVGIR